MTLSINAIKQLISKVKTRQDGRREFPDDLKKMIVQFHYKSGMALTTLALETTIAKEVLSKWKRTYGVDQTAFLHGTKMRNDVRTRCLAVREVLEYNQEPDKVATTYGVTLQSINTWINKYRDEYTMLIDSPDGIPYLIKEKKMVYGKTNIDKIRSLLQSQAQQLLCMIDTMHMSGAQAEAMKKCAEETLNKEAALVEAATILAENGLDIK